MKSDRLDNTWIDNTKSNIKNKNKNPKSKKIEDIEGKFEMGSASSATDCTGVQQQAIMTHDEQENLKEVYDFGPPEI